MNIELKCGTCGETWRAKADPMGELRRHRAVKHPPPVVAANEPPDQIIDVAPRLTATPVEAAVAKTFGITGEQYAEGWHRTREG